MKRDLTEAIMTFNYAPAVYIDASWFQSIPHGDIMKTLVSSESGKPWVSRFLLQEKKLLHKIDLNFKDHTKMLAIQPKQALVQIVFYAGIVLNCHYFRSIILRQQRKAIEVCLGDKAYRYALKKAPLLGGRLSELLPCPFEIDWSAPEEMKKHVFRSGMRLIGIVFYDESDAFNKRLLMKFPMASQDYFYGASADGQLGDDRLKEIQKLGKAVLKKLMKEFGV